MKLKQAYLLCHVLLKTLPPSDAIRECICHRKGDTENHINVQYKKIKIKIKKTQSL